MKSHFTFTKKQRNGIFLLLLIIILLQAVYSFVDFSSKVPQVNEEELLIFQNEIDSLRLVEIENRKPKIYPFNPNFITDYKGYTLGMTNEEIDRLLQFRAEDKWVNSAEEFQNVTKISDSLLAIISPYFKFPEWITNPKPKSNYSYQNNNEPKTFEQKQDLNTASASQLQKVNGIGEAYSKRIVAYRNKYGGFIADVQLQEVYGLSPEVIERITEQFTVKTPRQVEKIHLNTATIEELVTIQYIDYEVAHHIIEQRTLREGYNSLDELLKVKSFPANKIEIIKLYLKLN
ncbi:ComEA family DNA-binding protein [Xanthomarina spongicola]|uniref:Competence ComEA-like helix-hairpin-helix protein n=1 Tax=Xanthomarina spongicola TaxID=570520 RepID=A0A316DL02_9FLAO|nr:helix-hairpin-helix domain-containing protein [Xanthomarina spongicola]PWK18182.1 competence ComEA-like helix-hairpin-helix protein [Xanthomarina spongicola]